MGCFSGILKPISNRGKWYIITFIDDYSKKTWVYFRKIKIYCSLQNFKMHVEKEEGMPIKILCNGYGGGYNSHEFVNFCEMHEIKKQLIATYTPQQNRVSERKNCTIMNMVRSILAKSGIPKNFLLEAVN